MNPLKKDNYFNITNAFFVLAILIFSITSLFHVTVFWLITNSLFLSVIMSVATGVGIISSLLSTKYTKLTYISFTLIILIELFGNIYGSFIHIDINSEYFKGWKELMEPVFGLFYTVEEGEAIPDAIYKRWAAIIQGSFIPLLLSITFHMWMVVRDKYEKLKFKGNKFHEKAKVSEEPVKIEEPVKVENPVKEVKRNDGRRSMSINFPMDLIKKKNPEPEILIEKEELISEEINEVSEEVIEIEEPKEEVKEEVKEEIKEESKVETKKILKPRVINVKSDDIGTIYLKPENGNK